MFYERKSLTPTETLVGKAKLKELLNPFISIPQGKTTLALVSDESEISTWTSLNRERP